MNKISIGRTRKKSKEETCPETAGHSRTADAVFVFGAAAVCVMLTLPLLQESAERPLPGDMAIPVMASAGTVAGREELAAPSAAEEEEWNFYDYIGELFAGLISGRG